MNNKQFAETDVKFQTACSAVNIPPTARQASKFKMKKGKAFKGK